MAKIIFTPIGIIHSPFHRPEGTPIQPAAAADVAGTVTVFPAYQEGLQDLEGFSHLFLIYHFHLSKNSTLKVTPFLDQTTRGVFATRAPSRPNPIGISVVRLDRIEGATLFIRDVDVIDGTPLLDLKPYVPAFDSRTDARIGWLAANLEKMPKVRDDGRFSAPKDDS
ncbi:MAG: tRNA (N6-threonylcarbamoyladenosine(37)-N6)-methyltransferase TrmO [Deltaproteobacteria bacterium]|nr:tRNA (N6-threonylcarbamoyladenosine(37)-N6)-methyltransferase TrmO [Deltaproteobacteria bacterium]